MGVTSELWNQERRAWLMGMPADHTLPLRCHASPTWTPNSSQTLGAQDVSWNLFVEGEVTSACCHQVAVQL